MSRTATILVLAAAVGCGGRQVPGVVMPERPTRGVAPTGKDRGDVEIGLGAVTAAVAATLIGLGVYTAVRSVKLRAYCMQEPILTTVDMPDPVFQSLCNDLSGADPARASAISSGLAFAFSVPIAVASGFLLRKGVRMRKAYKRVQGLSLQPWAPGHRGGGMALGFSF